MHLRPTPIPGVYEVQSPAHTDNRGSFQRAWCADTFAAAGLTFQPHQASLSTNTSRHTLRGLHWQAPPQGEQKLVRCVAGTIWDVAVDLRPDSPTYRHWHAAELSATQGNALFLPQGIAHGFLTLTDNAVIHYLIDQPHMPEAARGARYNDPAFAIDWPAPPAIISDRDATWPDHA